MPKIFSNTAIQGLSDEQVLLSRMNSGENRLLLQSENEFSKGLKALIKEPMVLLLFAASFIYFLSGNIADGIFLSSAIVIVAAISIYQDSRSRNAINKLKDLTQPVARVYRNGTLISINTNELVPGDSLVTEEGTYVQADGIIIQSNDFSVDESILTGESLPVFKESGSENNRVYQGTTVVTGLAISTVTATGNSTRLGMIGKSLVDIKIEKTPLEIQIGKFVRKMVAAGAFFFIIVWLINFLRSEDPINSLLKALTLAMSILPEEIPVAFTTFMALGAWRLMKMGIIVKDMKTVETLGSASVICTDKTGTITQGNMTLAKLYVLGEDRILNAGANLSTSAIELVTAGMWASEPIPFDPMELALHDCYARNCSDDERDKYKISHEYPLEGKPPMMTHIFEDKNGNRIIAAKGAPEAFIAISDMNNEQKDRVLSAVNSLGEDGFRILGIATASFTGSEFPSSQQKFNFTFLGLAAFHDPPKANIERVLHNFYKAGIKVKIITGDNALTTAAIARQVGFRGYEKSISGDQLMALNDEELKIAVSHKNVFTRMFPEAKLKIINTLKAQGEIVAMTGDGVNDGPALKSAHIGIAMGKKGTEIAKQAAAMILVKDDLKGMVDAIRIGRKIYTNLKKAIQYVISIHIPIILIVFIPLSLGWIYPAVFSPVHVIFLELIMGPTCSIIYENEPVERNTMNQKPRPLSTTFFNLRELATSVLQGLAITAGLLLVYQYAVTAYFNEKLTRTMVFATLIAANIFLTLINRSFYYSMLETLTYRNKLVPYIISLTIALTAILIYLEPMSGFFGFVALSAPQLFISIATGFLSVVWYELVKWNERRSKPLTI